MFESALLIKLVADSTLIGLLSTFGDKPAIFAGQAPEKAILPYITTRIMKSGVIESPAIMRFTVMVDVWNYGPSAAKVNQAAERIEFLLDRCELDHERYANIRLFLFGGGLVEDPDPRVIHYNQQFEARAGRKKWVTELTEEPAKPGDGGVEPIGQIVGPKP